MNILMRKKGYAATAFECLDTIVRLMSIKETNSKYFVKSIGFGGGAQLQNKFSPRNSERSPPRSAEPTADHRVGADGLPLRLESSERTLWVRPDVTGLS
jgi:hypothetical protein